MKNIFVSILCMVLVISAEAADILPAARDYGWTSGTNVGVEGGIPTLDCDFVDGGTDCCVTSACNTLYNSGTVTAAQIASAVSSTSGSSYEVVRIPARGGGLFWSMNAGIYLRNYTVLRGEVDSDGEPTTKLDFGSSSSNSALIRGVAWDWPADGWDNITIRSVSSGLSEGSTSLTLSASPSGLSANEIMVIDQVDDGTLINDGTEGHQLSRPSGGTRSLAQHVVVTSVDGSVVTFRPGLIGPRWSTGRSPEVYWLDENPQHHIGVENIEIDRNSQSSYTVEGSIALGNMHNAWLKNVKSTQAQYAHVRPYYAVFIEIRGSWFQTHDSNISSTYTIRPDHVTGMLVENNVIYDTPCATTGNPLMGSVIAYNYVQYFPWPQYPNQMPEIHMYHGGHPMMNLFEGNYTYGKFIFDNYHGNSSYNVVANNRIIGKDTETTSGATIPIDTTSSDHAYSTVVGNILGDDAWHNSYSSGDRAIYNSTVLSMGNVIAKGNYNTVNDTVPAGESLSGSTIANSYYLNVAPSSWWCVETTWPPVEASTTTTGNISSITIPAKIRYEGGTCTLSLPAKAQNVILKGAVLQ